MALVATLIAVLVLAAGGGGGMSIADKAGDAHGAPDITALDIGVSDTGLATFRVAVASSKTGSVSVYIDSDNDATTGSPAEGGADYVFSHYQSDLTDYFYRWIGGAQGWAPMANMNSVRATHDTKGITFSVNRSVLGEASQIRVFATSAGPVSQVGAADRAPNSGMTTFDLAPFTLKVAGFNAAEAGGLLTLTMAATRSDTSAYVSSEAHDLLTCKATSGGVTLPRRTVAIITLNAVPEGTCVWTVPKKLRGKTLHASITESSEGRSVTRTATLKAR